MLFYNIDLTIYDGHTRTFDLNIKLFNLANTEDEVEIIRYSQRNSIFEFKDIPRYKSNGFLINQRGSFFHMAKTEKLVIENLVSDIKFIKEIDINDDGLYHELDVTINKLQVGMVSPVYTEIIGKYLLMPKNEFDNLATAMNFSFSPEYSDKYDFDLSFSTNLPQMGSNWVKLNTSQVYKLFNKLYNSMFISGFSHEQIDVTEPSENESDYGQNGIELHFKSKGERGERNANTNDCFEYAFSVINEVLNEK
jgi:hypothetical protein